MIVEKISRSRSIILIILCGILFFSLSSVPRSNVKSISSSNGKYRPDCLPYAWHALPNQGFSEHVNTLEAVGENLFIGGWFTETVDAKVTNLGNIARYDIKTNVISPLPNQGLVARDWTLNFVLDFAAKDTDLYVGGFFTETGDGTLKDLGSIARYDVNSEKWHSLPNRGIDTLGTVHTLMVHGDNLYVGGFFEGLGDGSLLNLGNIARYDTTTGNWYAFPNSGLTRFKFESVDAFAVQGNDLYIGGGFSSTGDGTQGYLGNIVRYDTKSETWHPLQNGLCRDSLDFCYVSALALYGDDLYAGGGFDRTGDQSLKNLGNIARYDTKINTWHSLPRNGLNDSVTSLAVYGTDLIVGGQFTATGDGGLQNLGHIARYDMEEGIWHALPNQGLIDAEGVPFGYYSEGVERLEVHDNKMFAAGEFTQTGDGAVKNLGNIVRFDLDVPGFIEIFPLMYR